MRRLLWLWGFLTAFLLVRLLATGCLRIGVDEPPPSWGAIAVDPSTAPHHLLRALPGIGPERADALILHRVRHGPFRTAEDLLSVPGIGPVTVAAMGVYLPTESREKARGGGNH